jgi:N-acyl amino acid synthase of PEP-CTERM/exosortase system
MKSVKTMLADCAHAVKRRSFLNIYHQTFELIKADTPQLKHEAYRLRYSVYCNTQDYYDPADPLGQIEKDAYDDSAAHYLLLLRKTGDIVGTLRVVFPALDEGWMLPLQAECDHPLLKMSHRVEKLCEISRFCMAQRFRSREADGRFLAAYHDQDSAEAKKSFVRSIPYPQAALLQGAFETALSKRLTDCVMLIEPSHLPSLSAIGMAYRTLGPQIGPYGGIQPVIFNIKNTLDTMRSKAPFCWEIISDNGRLQALADTLAQNDWQDALIDPECWDRIYEHCSQKNA